MEKALTKHWPFAAGTRFIAVAFAGSLLMTLGSLIIVPFFPVPFTLQTLCVYLLALTLSPHQAFAAVLFYLGEATLGFPVLSGNVNPFWMIGNCAGYLFAFPVAAYLISSLKERASPLLAILSGQIVIYSLGFLWLSFLFGIKTALFQGVLIFIPSEIVRASIAFFYLFSWKKQKTG